MEDTIGISYEYHVIYIYINENHSKYHDMGKMNIN